MKRFSKIKVGIIGTGNIGTDLLIKIQRSKYLECGIFTGRNPNSQGIKIAKAMAVRTSCDSVRAIQNDPSCCEIVFDATSEKAHLYNASILKKLKKYTIDLTPSRVGKMCVPILNMKECLHVDNINLVSCSGQTILPIASVITKIHPNTEYIEIVASIASKSAGSGMRDNIDEFTQATRDAIILFTGVKMAKAIIILNPAEPPVLMHNTIYAKIKNPDIKQLRSKIMAMAKKIKKYVPGYNITVGPIAENGRVTTMIEVAGQGDYLPTYSGNLDIITSAAVTIAEEYVKKNL